MDETFEIRLKALEHQSHLGSSRIQKIWIERDILEVLIHAYREIQIQDRIAKQEREPVASENWHLS